eukprot:EG_transcript_12144
MATPNTIDEDTLRAVLEQVSQLDEGMKGRLRNMLPNVDHTFEASLLKHMTSTNSATLEEVEKAQKDVQQTLHQITDTLHASMAQASATANVTADQHARVVRAKLAAEAAARQLQLQMEAIEKLEDRVAKSLSRADVVQAGFQALDEQFRAGTRRLAALLEEAELDELPVMSYFHQAGTPASEEDTQDGWHSSSFPLALSHCDGPCCLDADSDDEDAVELRYRVRTSLAEVGLQVWQAAPLLVDYVVHHHRHFHGAVVVELGAGAGLTSVVLSRFARVLFATDHLPSVLENLQHNMRANAAFSGAGTSRCRVRWLDFAEATPSPLTHDAVKEPIPTTGEWEWVSSDWEALEGEVPVIVAADVTYNATPALMAFLRRYFCRYSQGSALLAVEERRPDFLKALLPIEQHTGADPKDSMEDFARHLDAVTHGDGSPPPCRSPSRAREGSGPLLVGERLALDFPAA